MRHGVELAQELERLEILAAAVLVRQPLARLAAVIQVQHRGDGVHAQSVDVITLHPEQRVRDQEVLHLVAAVVEDLRAPVAVFAQPRVGVFVQRGAVEFREAMRVLRKVRRHPVEDHADAGLVALVDEGHELLRRAVARGRRVVTHHLVAPRAVEWMFGHAHELDVRVAHVDDVGNEPLGRVRPREERRLAIPGVLPAREVHFVDVDRRAPPVPVRAIAQPVGVVPFVAIERSDDGRGLRALLHEEAERIGLEQQ